VLVGNKIDLEHERVISTRDGMMLAHEHDIPLFFEVSAKDDLPALKDMFNIIVNMHRGHLPATRNYSLNPTENILKRFLSDSRLSDVNIICIYSDARQIY
jgi:hypothetical protein